MPFDHLDDHHLHPDAHHDHEGHAHDTHDLHGHGHLDAHDPGHGLQSSPAALSSSWHVPWQQITPDAMQHDVDGDGIPDALDNHVGPGA